MKQSVRMDTHQGMNALHRQPLIAIAVLLTAGATCLLAALATVGAVAGLQTLALVCAGPLQVALAVALLRRAAWAVPVAILTLAVNVVLCLSVGLMMMLTAGLGGDLLLYRGSGAADVQAIVASLAPTAGGLTVLGLAIRSAAGLTLNDLQPERQL